MPRAQILILVLAIAAAGAAAFFGLKVPSQATATADVGATPEPTSATQPADVIEGVVLERIDVDKYTYLRLDTGSGEGTWTAVSTARAAVGERVRVRNPQLMTAFKSTALNRTFDSIYFGVLDDGSEALPPMADFPGLDPHANMAMPNPHGASNGAPGPAMTGTKDPHAKPYRAETNVEVPKLEKAPGPLGRSIAEVHAQRAQLRGKRVRVRGVVVKSIPGVMNSTFVHLRDGSGDSEATRDLTVTTDAEPKVGTHTLFEGTLSVDKDFGAGYRYAAILENARTISE